MSAPTSPEEERVADLIQGVTAPSTLDDVVADLQAQQLKPPAMTVGMPGMEEEVR